MVDFGPVGNLCYFDYYTLSVHVCVLYLVHILGRCYETEKKSHIANLLLGSIFEAFHRLLAEI